MNPYGLDEINNVIDLVEKHPNENWNGFVDEMIIEALEFYRDTHYIG